MGYLFEATGWDSARTTLGAPDSAAGPPFFGDEIGTQRVSPARLIGPVRTRHRRSGRPVRDAGPKLGVRHGNGGIHGGGFRTRAFSSRAPGGGIAASASESTTSTCSRGICGAAVVHGVKRSRTTDSEQGARGQQHAQSSSARVSTGSRQGGRGGQFQSDAGTRPEQPKQPAPPPGPAHGRPREHRPLQRLDGNYDRGQRVSSEHVAQPATLSRRGRTAMPLGSDAQRQRQTGDIGPARADRRRVGRAPAGRAHDRARTPLGHSIGQPGQPDRAAPVAGDQPARSCGWSTRHQAGRRGRAATAATGGVAGCCPARSGPAGRLDREPVTSR